MVLRMAHVRSEGAERDPVWSLPTELGRSFPEGIGERAFSSASTPHDGRSGLDPVLP